MHDECPHDANTTTAEVMLWDIFCGGGFEAWVRALNEGKDCVVFAERALVFVLVKFML